MIRAADGHTAATQHLGWGGIVEDIEQRFEHTPIVQKYGIDTVSAYLLGQHDRAKHDMICLGEALSKALVEICQKHGVDLGTLAVQHVND